MSVLTAKQEKFAQCVALEDMTYTDAYKTAYNTKNMSNKTANEQACILANDPKIAARIAELRAEIAKDKIMSAQERLEWLTKVVKGEETDYKDGLDCQADLNTRIRAVDTMNKMTGEYTTKIEGELKVKKLEDLI